MLLILSRFEIWRDDQDTVTVTAREDPSERGRQLPADVMSLPD